MAIRIKARLPQSVDETDDHAISAVGWLDGAEVISAVTLTLLKGPSGATVTGMDSAAVTTGYTDDYTGESVASGQGVDFRISFDAKGVYVLLLECTTSTGRTPKREYLVKVV